MHKDINWKFQMKCSMCGQERTLELLTYGLQNVLQILPL